MSSAVENILGVEIEPKSELASAIKATGGKPSRVFPFIVNDFSLYGYFDVDLYRYNGIYYEEFTDFDIERMVRKFYLDNSLDDSYTVSKARELKAMLKYDPRIVKDVFDNYHNLVNLRNGVFNYDTKEITKHSKDYKFTYCLDVSYKPNTNKDCPAFKRFLEGCFATSGSWDEGYEYDKDSYENILRLGGYLLYPQNKIEGLFLLIGEGSNGKSVLMDTLRMFFPKKYITNLSLNAISNEDNFSRESLIRSKINFCSEQRGGAINSEELKRVASGEGVSIKRKFKDNIELDSMTKICVSANNMPYFNDTTHGILRRLFFFNFKNKFVSKRDFEKETNPEMRRVFEGKNKDWLKEELEHEKEAIFELFLGGLERLKENNWEFVQTDNMSDILDEYKEGADVVGTWLKDNYELGDLDDFIPVNDIYFEFRNFYESSYNKRCPYSVITVGKAIRSRFRFEESVTNRGIVNGRRVSETGYRLRPKTEAQALEELMSMGRKYGEPEPEQTQGELKW